MAYMEYVKINGILLPFPKSYNVSLTDVEADSSGETEAGTIQRDVVRHGMVTIELSYAVTSKWLKTLTAFAKLDKLTVEYFDTEDLNLKTTFMYMVNFKSRLEKDTSYKGLWSVSFTLKEF